MGGLYPVMDLREAYMGGLYPVFTLPGRHNREVYTQFSPQEGHIERFIPSSHTSGRL